MVADHTGERIHYGQALLLHRGGGEGIANAHTLPGLGRLRLFPAQLPYGRLGKGDARIHFYGSVSGIYTGELPLGHSHNVGDLGIFHVYGGDQLRPGTGRDKKSGGQPQKYDPAAKTEQLFSFMQRYAVQHEIPGEQRVEGAPPPHGVSAELKQKREYEQK